MTQGSCKIFILLFMGEVGMRAKGKGWNDDQEGLLGLARGFSAHFGVLGETTTFTPEQIDLYIRLFYLFVAILVPSETATGINERSDILEYFMTIRAFLGSSGAISDAAINTLEEIDVYVWIFYGNYNNFVIFI